MNCLENNTTCIGGKKLFACEYPGCDQVFRTKFSCKRHTLTHTKEKPHTCEECGKKFSLMQHLKEHSYRHSKQKPYVCGVDGCTQSFRHASELSLHRRTHSDYKLRKYKFFKPRVVAEKPAHKASKDTLSEGRDDGKTFDSNKKTLATPKDQDQLGRHSNKKNQDVLGRCGGAGHDFPEVHPQHHGSPSWKAGAAFAGDIRHRLDERILL
eukprot:TRINITY_DN3104_c0_g1_i3.p1 TRINITY_DN3104_c0_g1~~TRINITY_DN3104_c0_g1_i3.p1  ORF type:complete len:210 (-),score=14.69 TRINITY_DN3104_c0_g1_i3:101-730(-)